MILIGAASHGNPGAAGAGVVFLDPHGRVQVRCYRDLGRCTSNEAGYQALLSGLERTLARGMRAITIRASGELIVKQLTGSYEVRDANLQRLHAAARALLRRFDCRRADHVPRSAHREPHRIAQKAISTHHWREPTIAS